MTLPCYVTTVMGGLIVLTDMRAVLSYCYTTGPQGRASRPVIFRRHYRLTIRQSISATVWHGTSDTRADMSVDKNNVKMTTDDVGQNTDSVGPCGAARLVSSPEGHARSSSSSPFPFPSLFPLPTLFIFSHFHRIKNSLFYPVFIIQTTALIIHDVQGRIQE